MLVVEGPDAVGKDPIVPRVLPALVVHLVAETLASLFRGLDVHDFCFIEHVHMEAKHLFVLVELRLGLPRWCHDAGSGGENRGEQRGRKGGGEEGGWGEL